METTIIVKSYHRDTLLLCVNEANAKRKRNRKRNCELEQRERLKTQSHYQEIEDFKRYRMVKVFGVLKRIKNRLAPKSVRI